MFVSVIIPTYNGRKRIGNTLTALLNQEFEGDFEILVIDDGSTDNTAEFVKNFGGDRIRIFSQANQGPAAARNYGAQLAKGEIILFTDDDCVPLHNWLSEMLKPFHENDDIVAVKGRYKTKQRSLIARFVQIEYEDKYDVMLKNKYIDFIDTYSAAFKRDIFLEFDGYDTSFPVACAEDVELSYRMSQKGYKMVFNPRAIVFHSHPDNLLWYMKKKYKFAFWRMMAVQKNPQKFIKDSHTPQAMKIQLLIAPIISITFLCSFFSIKIFNIFLLSSIAFGACSISFIQKALRRDRVIGLLSPFFLFLRSCSQFVGVVHGSLYVLKKKLLKNKT